MNYYQKYQKYRFKYLNLLNQSGGYHKHNYDDVQILKNSNFLIKTSTSLEEINTLAKLTVQELENLIENFILLMNSINIVEKSNIDNLKQLIDKTTNKLTNFRSQIKNIEESIQSININITRQQNQQIIKYLKDCIEELNNLKNSILDNELDVINQYLQVSKDNIFEKILNHLLKTHKINYNNKQYYFIYRTALSSITQQKYFLDNYKILYKYAQEKEFEELNNNNIILDNNNKKIVKIIESLQDKNRSNELEINLRDLIAYENSIEYDESKHKFQLIPEQYFNIYKIALSDDAQKQYFLKNYKFILDRGKTNNRNNLTDDQHLEMCELLFEKNISFRDIHNIICQSQNKLNFNQYYNICVQAITHKTQQNYFLDNFLLIINYFMDYNQYFDICELLFKKASDFKIIEKNKYLQICKLAVTNNGLVLQFIDKTILSNNYDYIEICELAVQQNGCTLKYVDKNKISKEAYLEICNIATDQNGFALKHVDNNILDKEEFNKISIKVTNDSFKRFEQGIKNPICN